MKLSGAVEQACCIMAILADPQRKAPITNDAFGRKDGSIADLSEEN